MKHGALDKLRTHIRLADVLLALDKMNIEGDCLTLEGQFAIYDAETDHMNLSGKWWNLRTDDLAQQSDETISFIHSLLA